MALRLVVVGNGVAGITAARTMADTLPGTEIEIYSAEPHRYYSRPRLWEYLAGETSREDLAFYPDSWYEERGITVHRGTEVTDLHPAGHEITLGDGKVVPYDRLLLAVGGHSFVPPIRGVEKEGVFTLRTLDDAVAMREYCKGSSRAIAVGGGLLGLETARALRVQGLKVTVLELFPHLMPRQLDAEGAEVLSRLLREMGLEIVTNAASEAVLGQGKAEGVALKGGDEYQGELVLISAGVRSNLDLAKKAGLKVERGIVVDDFLQTSAEDVYTVGDAAEHDGRVYGIIPAAIEQARVVGVKMAGGETEPYRGTVPSNTLKIVGIDLTSIGKIHPDGEGYLELRWEGQAGRRYRKLVLRDGRLVGAILLGDRQGVAEVSRLIAQQVDVSPFVERLLDEQVDWKALLEEIKAAKGANKKMDKWECLACGYIYDPEKGDPDSGVEPGTAFEDIPDDWVCPECGVGKDMFQKL